MKSSKLLSCFLQIILRETDLCNILYSRLAGDWNGYTPMQYESDGNKLGIRFRSSTLFNFRGMKLHYVVSWKIELKKYCLHPWKMSLNWLDVSLYRLNQRTKILKRLSWRTLLSMVIMQIIIIFMNSRLQKSMDCICNCYLWAGHCGQSNLINNNNEEIDDKIIGPGIAARGSFPWMAALLIDGRSFCGGSIISKRHILTAVRWSFKTCLWRCLKILLIALVFETQGTLYWWSKTHNRSTWCREH